MDAAVRRPPVSVRNAQLSLLIAAGVSLGCGLLITLLTARSVDPAELGLFALVATILTLARDATDLGTANVTVRRIVVAPEEERPALADLLGWRAGPCGFAAALLLGVAWAETNAAFQLVWLSAALCMLVYVNHSFSALFQARERLHVPASLNITTQLGALAACALLASRSAPAHHFAILIIVREAAFVLLLTAAAHRELGHVVMPNFGMFKPAKMFGNVGKTAIAALAYQLSLVWPLVQLSWMGEDEMLGYYGLAFRVGAPFFGLPWIIATPLTPEFARASADGGLWLSFRKGVGPLALVALIAATILLLASSRIVVTLFGAEYGPAAGPLAILGLAGLANCVAAFAVTALIAAGAHARVLSLGLSALTGMVLLSTVLVPVLGAVGAATSVAATLTIVAAVAVIWLRNG